MIASTNPDGFNDILEVLDTFAVDEERDLVRPGGNESQAAKMLNGAFKELGWREGSFRLSIVSELTLLPYKRAGETVPFVTGTEVDAESYRIDNIKDRLALDVEWHAKDGNLDRDLGAYRSLYDAGIIDAGCIITVKIADMQAWAQEVNPGTTKFNTSTTVNMEKAIPKLRRGDGGGIPILVVGVCRFTV